MKAAVAILLGGAFLFLQAGAASAPVEPPDLLWLIRQAGTAKLTANSATVYQDDRSGCMTMTFHYIHGDPEVIVPVADLGWPTDWSPFHALVFTLQSTSLEPIFIRLTDDLNTKDVILEPLEGIRIRGVIPFRKSDPEESPAIAPLGYKLFPENVNTPTHVQHIFFRMHFPSEPTQVTLCSLRLTHELPADDILDRHPLLDRFGQWIPEKWDGKAYSEDDLKKMWKMEDQQSPNATPSKTSLCPLGGDATRHRKATGFFRTEKIGDRWAFIDPHGHPFYSSGMDIVGNADSSFATEVTDRQYLFEELPAAGGGAWLTPEKIVSFYSANVIRRYGDNWQKVGFDHAVQRLRSWGFNTIGNWSDKDLAPRSGMPHVLPLYGWYTKTSLPAPYSIPDVFSDEFQANVETAARKTVDSKSDPNLIGYFLDNEPGWSHNALDTEAWADSILQDAEDSATKRKLQEMLSANPNDSANIKIQFPYQCIKKYLETVTRAVRKYDPNHLILGVRFAGNPGPQWVKLSSAFDVFSVNIYSDTFAPDSQKIKEYSEDSGRPVLIGEFTAATPGRGLEGTFYGVHKVRDHAERGVAYRYFVENSVASPYIIGSHWFQLVDDMPTGRPGDGERLNYGFVNVLDVPYQDLVDAARETHSRLYHLMFGIAKPVQTMPQMN